MLPNADARVRRSEINSDRWSLSFSGHCFCRARKGREIKGRERRRIDLRSRVCNNGGEYGVFIRGSLGGGLFSRMFGKRRSGFGDRRIIVVIKGFGFFSVNESCCFLSFPTLAWLGYLFKAPAEYVLVGRIVHSHKNEVLMGILLLYFIFYFDF